MTRSPRAFDLPSGSVRERKMRATYARILDSSSRLFRENGYDGTTVDQIAVDAGISVPTLLSYVGTKERMLLITEWQMTEYLESRLEDRWRQRSTIEIWRELAEYFCRAAMEDEGYVTRCVSYFRAESTRKAYLWLVEEHARILTRGLELDMERGATMSPTDARLAALMMAHGTCMYLEEWANHGNTTDLLAPVHELIDRAVKFARLDFSTMGNAPLAGRDAI